MEVYTVGVLRVLRTGKRDTTLAKALNGPNNMVQARLFILKNTRLFSKPEEEKTKLKNGLELKKNI